MYERASASITPHDGVGGCTPNPRKLKVASVRIAVETESEVRMISGAATFGNRWRRMIRQEETPTTRAASTYCSRITASAGPRAIRAKRGE
jgi:hypothetical protein